MNLPILIERVEGNGYRSSGGEPFSLSAEGATREEVIEKLKEQLRARIEGGSELISLEMPGVEHPLARFAGMFENDPLFDQWQESIREYRRRVESDSDYR